ncbi:N-acetylglucosamine-6-phosphate deacetylase [Mycoplasmopsis gallinacea]|uniref:N-acetylglucosamine-6-phosphate deacetylase n=1 Tax=Mycoplasmopsis gallinacea TaxID=29556 RepID=A0A0D5ZK30_9BACT|nr:N-acetylglucosamine-6-phosphate deacetylase [Mycoplasmopsis gallinacea]
MKIIENVTVVNADSTIECADIYIENDKISKIVPKEGQKTEKLAIPGFIDTHIHGFVGYDVMEGTKATEIISENLAKYGVTSFMPTAMTNSWEKILASLNEISLNQKWVSKNLGLHIEGPYIGENKKGAHKSEWLLKASDENLNQMYQASNKMLRKISFDPKMVDLNVLKKMFDLNIIPSIGHSDASFDISQEYFTNGCASVCHLWNAMSGVDSRKPGMAQAALMNPDVYTELIVDLNHVSTQTVKFTIQNKGVDKVYCVSDAIKPAYGPNGDSISGGVAVVKQDLLITIKENGTIAGSGITLYDSFKNIIKLGYSIQNAVALTSTNVATMMNLDLGAIKENKIADLVILNKKNLDILSVYVNGNKI